MIPRAGREGDPGEDRIGVRPHLAEFSRPATPVREVCGQRLELMLVWSRKDSRGYVCVHKHSSHLELPLLCSVLSRSSFFLKRLGRSTDVRATSSLSKRALGFGVSGRND